ncbi:MAG: Holliday junction branch migration protein RuvA [Desulfomonilaceae bacterium]|nr:Holliday junction branch migration protein RuvA [Desulfomonilaceae bacterium]
MIACLRGNVLYRGINRLVVDVQGVGYEVSVSLATLDSIPRNGEIFLHVHTALRENALELYGFCSEEEKALFEMLITVKGIGAKTSLVILSGISPEGLRNAVLGGDVHRLTSIPGVGRKSAERIILELKEKMRKLGTGPLSGAGEGSASSLEEDLVSSLVNLGYKDRVACAAAKKVLEESGSQLTLTRALKAALKDLMK